VIWEVLVNIIVAPIKLIFGLFPVVEVPFFADGSTATASGMGAKAAALDSFLPVVEVFTIGFWVVGVILPVAAGYTIANWIWRHIPEVWGFGTGAG
jgi:hypothetical protein